MRSVFSVFVLFLLTACMPQTGDDCRRQGEGVMRRMIRELHPIESHKELVRRETRIRRLYLELAEVMVRAGRVDPPCQRPLDPRLNEQLQRELQRVYALEGGQAIMERAQEEALRHLQEAGLLRAG